MLFKSTRSKGETVSFNKAVLRCLPPDDGLYVPASPVDLRQYFLHMNEDTTYPDLVAAITPSLLAGELNPFSARRVAESAFAFSPTVRTLDDRLSILDLTNGPTGTFKDFGIAFLAAAMEELLKPDGRALTMTATTGDTGVSIARAFGNRVGVRSVILYPEGPIRGLKEADFVTKGGNILPIQIRGNFDDCQRLIREAFQDTVFAERYGLTSANTINIGRLLPQTFYFIYAFVKLKKFIKGDLMFAIPSGNFGNLLAALYAWEFGLPANGLIAAMNANDSFGQYLRGNRFEPRVPIPTVSLSMDVGNPANYERLADFYRQSPAVMRNMVFPDSVDDNETLGAMERAWTRYGLLLDPHGAVGYAAAERMLVGDTEEGHIVVVATGHPAKHADLVAKATGQRPESNAALDAYMAKAEPIAYIEPRLNALEAAIADCGL